MSAAVGFGITGPMNSEEVAKTYKIVDQDVSFLNLQVLLFSPFPIVLSAPLQPRQFCKRLC